MDRTYTGTATVRGIRCRVVCRIVNAPRNRAGDVAFIRRHEPRLKRLRLKPAPAAKR
jgi:hypothetical protein